MVHLDQFMRGEITEDCVAELAAHLKIAVYLPWCDSAVIDAGRKVLNKIIREWKTIEGISEEEAELVEAAIMEYDRVVRGWPRGAIQQAISKAVK